MLLRYLHDLLTMSGNKSIEFSLEAILQELESFIAHHIDLTDDTLIQLVLSFKSFYWIKVLILARLSELRTGAYDH